MVDHNDPHFMWVSLAQDEIRMIRLELDRLDDQGRVDFRLSKKLEDLQRQVEYCRKLKEQDL